MNKPHSMRCIYFILEEILELDCHRQFSHFVSFIYKLISFTGFSFNCQWDTFLVLFPTHLLMKKVIDSVTNIFSYHSFDVDGLTLFIFFTNLRNRKLRKQQNNAVTAWCVQIYCMLCVWERQRESIRLIFISGFLINNHFNNHLIP